ncbi:hypothetical protein U1Q18_002308 [Sarracenia purpurea var. burkii]
MLCMMSFLVYKEFFNLREAKKKEFEGKHMFDPIQFGTSFSTVKAQQVLLWRDFLKVDASVVARWWQL